MKISSQHRKLLDELGRRVLLLDGAMGTMVQRYHLSEADYKGQMFRDIPFQLKGCHDVLCLTRRDVIGEIHSQYLEAGADIITANSFNANEISLSDYGLEDLSYEIARAAAQIAREAADAYTVKNPVKPRFVAGTIGPTNKSASLACDMTDPAKREITFDRLVKAYSRQVEGLVDGGADIILIETVFDTLNAKAAMYSVDEIGKKRNIRIPVMISATISNREGRLLSGQTVEAFYTSVSHADLLSVGLNCGFGPEQLLPYARILSDISRFFTSCHPNAGLPDESGEYTQTPVIFAENARKFLEDGTVNIIGGCCGTTPEHIREISAFIGQQKPRKPRLKSDGLLELSNLDTLKVGALSNFINIGERTNVAGSAKFARLIREKKYDEALEIASRQIEAGARIIDICMDHALIDAPEAMRTFMNLLAAEPEIARVPVMIDSSDWNVIIEGLKVSQGKCIVNSISLKEGEDKFIERSREIRRFGAAAVVMLFDEKGQADTFERKIEVARRAYDLLIDDGFAAEDIIFDPNILTIGTGIAQHDRYAVDFIDAVAWIKKNLPGVRLTGGVSNLSFAFRGNNPLREAIHSVFLYHAIKAGLDMAIVNAQTLRIYSDIESGLLERVEDLVLARRTDAADRLMEFYNNSDSVSSESSNVSDDAVPASTPESLIEQSLLRGKSEGLSQIVERLLSEYDNGLEVIEHVLMPCMDRVGVLFGEGKMFLPQVLKSARVLREAIDLIAPDIESADKTVSRGSVVVATVKGDIHDIGKNIVSLVASCNGFDIIDLGVMAEATKITDETEKIRPVAVLLSGLITPSLTEMVKVVEEFERRGLRVPVIVGGATTTALHTALKIAPVYTGPVFHSNDASHNTRILTGLAGAERETLIAHNRKEQENLRKAYEDAAFEGTLITLEEARKKARLNGLKQIPRSLRHIIFTDVNTAEVSDFIDWNFFASAWGFRGSLDQLLSDPKTRGEVRKVLDDAHALLTRFEKEGILKLEGVVRTFKARKENEDIIIEADRGEVRLPMLRSQSSLKNGECVADYVSDDNGDVTLFALTAGKGLKEFVDECRKKGDDYTAVLAKLLADRLAEAMAEKISLDFPGARFAFGYPAVPDHTLKRETFDLLEVESLTSMRLTENAMITPEESLCGLIVNGGKFFTLGKIGNDQLEVYAAGRGISPEDLRQKLPSYLFDR